MGTIVYFDFCIHYSVLSTESFVSICHPTVDPPLSILPSSTPFQGMWLTASENSYLEEGKLSPQLIPSLKEKPGLAQGINYPHGCQIQSSKSGSDLVLVS